MVSRSSATPEHSPYVMTEAEIRQHVVPMSAPEKLRHIALTVFNENIDIFKRLFRLSCHFPCKTLHVLVQWVHGQALRTFLLLQKQQEHNRKKIKTWNQLWNDPNLTWNRFCHPPGHIPEWKKNSDGLIVLLSGLWDSTLHWNRHIRLIAAHNVPIDIYVPLIPYAGNCPLDRAYPTILDTVRQYTQMHPGKPVALIAMSNGGRIAHTIAKHFPDVPMMLSCIASPFFGSPAASLVFSRSLHKIFPFVSGEMCRELSYGSDKARSLLEEIVNAKATAERIFRFYASQDDVLVPLASALPKIGKENCTFQIVKGVGHAAITEMVAERQVNECMDWLLTHQIRSKAAIRCKL